LLHNGITFIINKYSLSMITIWITMEKIKIYNQYDNWITKTCKVKYKNRTNFILYVAGDVLRLRCRIIYARTKYKIIPIVLSTPYTQASGSINFGDVNRTFKSADMPLARPHSLPMYCIQLFVLDGTCPYGILSAASPFGECTFGHSFWTRR